jgi:hypothetical protein
MDEQGPDKEFEATDYDEKDNIKLLPPPVAAKKKHRITVAELNKAINNIQDVKFPETLEWLGELATRLDTLEQEEEPRTRQALAYLKTRLDSLDKGSLPDRQNVAEDIADKLDNQDAAIGALADALRSHIKEMAAAPQPAETETEFAKPPEQTAGGQASGSAIEAVASVCLNMTDVLMITRALKEIPELTDAKRKEILRIACISSGVINTPGLQIRAGVKFVGA